MLKIKGIYAAVVTPYDHNGQASGEAFIDVLRSLKEAGAHGALLTGTNGEGPQLSVEERIALYRAVAQTDLPDDSFTLLAGTGAVSLVDTIEITRAAYQAGLAAACILPPFFFSNVTEDGLFRFYESIITEAVPDEKPVVLYNNPRVISVSLGLSLIARIREAFPAQIVGIKDSSGDAAFFDQLRTLFPDLQVLVGSDSLLEHALTNGGSGSITGSTNLFAADLRKLYDAHMAGQPIRELFNAHLEKIQPLRKFPTIAMTKSVLAARGILANAAVRAPLENLTARQETELFELIPAATV